MKKNLDILGVFLFLTDIDFPWYLCGWDCRLAWVPSPRPVTEGCFGINITRKLDANSIGVLLLVMFCWDANESHNTKYIFTTDVGRSMKTNITWHDKCGSNF